MPSSNTLHETRNKTRYNMYGSGLLGSIYPNWIMLVISWGVLMKCKFYKQCPLYSDSSITCNKTEGIYGDRKATCYKKMEIKNE